ncbi:DUF892 family protein [Pontivivens insulae]|uniref:Uncharacterized protein n=1 Tax=Pontivivens insulae TaxID=1639689 RepID=A0A2R8A871_9RHOB|nr:DUF892 family protein [Pontivivens insulae]RED18508.1 ferritin-like metal-binding protein YciE [Pontivivens insulae]SPF28406.1 hypothetical protein POI8812_00705 [Pontivivens insulae]
MALNTLKDIYIDQMQDIYSACKQSKSATLKLVEQATDEDLRHALKAGVVGIDKGMETLEGIIKAHGADPEGEFCKGMEGLVKEVEAHVIDATFGDDAAKDAMIITQYQRMAHYAIAGYGCCKAFAKRLSLDEDAHKLDKCLEASYEGDETMTEIATGTRGINAEAA